jgi:hypothetical protein
MVAGRGVETNGKDKTSTLMLSHWHAIRTRARLREILSMSVTLICPLGVKWRYGNYECEQAVVLYMDSILHSLPLSSLLDRSC